MMVKKSTKSNFKKYIYITLAIASLFIASAAWKIYEDVLSPNVNLTAGETAYLYVHTNQDFETLTKDIEGKKVLRNLDALKRLVKLLGYESRIKPGKYKLTSDMGNLQIIKMIVAGKQEPFDINFKYAERKQDLAAFWGSQLEADSNDILNMLNDSSFTSKFELTPDNIITVFIPNKYNFYWNTSAFKLINRMLDEYDHFWDSTRVNKANKLGLTKPQVSIFASIVQKETHNIDEMPIVAGVYYNRFKKGLLFQADPTIIYAMNDKTIRRVAGKMLDVESPYNTYKYKGLPPGPICVPSVQAIDAVLNLKLHKYVYFCAKEDFSGYHNFAETFAQHQINAQKFQRELNKRGIR